VSIPSVPNQPKSVSTKKIPFVVSIPGATRVAVTGSFSQWTKDGIPLKNGSAGQWQAVLDLAPGRHEYRLIVDGQWRDDPTAKARVPNAYGTQNCVLTIT